MRWRVPGPGAPPVVPNTQMARPQSPPDVVTSPSLANTTAECHPLLRLAVSNMMPTLPPAGPPPGGESFWAAGHVDPVLAPSVADAMLPPFHVTDTLNVPLPLLGAPPVGA